MLENHMVLGEYNPEREEIEERDPDFEMASREALEYQAEYRENNLPDDEIPEWMYRSKNKTIQGIVKSHLINKRRKENERICNA